MTGPYSRAAGEEKTMKPDQKKVRKALKEFLKNPYWRDYYLNAPSEACKRYIEFEFYNSEYDEFASNEEFWKVRDSYWDQLSVEDWKYILKHTAVNPFRKTCLDKIRELQQKQMTDPS